MMNLCNFATLICVCGIFCGINAFVVSFNDSKAYTLYSFSWNNCDNSELPAYLKTLKISPDPIDIPGTVVVSASAFSSLDLASPLKVSLTVQRKVTFFWITIPCIMGVGSCTYDDFCTVLEKAFPPKTPCPPFLKKNGIPCRCPFAAGTYDLPPSPVKISAGPSIPSWLTNGEYSMKIEVEHANQEINCEEISFSLSSSSLPEDSDINGKVATKMHDVL